jgi:hypothetical protein
VHVRLAPAGAGRGLSAAARLLPLFLTLAAGAIAGGCNRPARDLAFEWTLSPATPVVGHSAALSVRLLDEKGRRVPGAKLQIEAHMSHPGMAPVVARVTEPESGLYMAILRFTMPGDWILLVSGSLADGTPVQRRIDVPGVKAGR